MGSRRQHCQWTLKVLRLSLAQAKIVGDCTFGNVKSWESNKTTSPKMKISGQLPSSRNRRHSCVVKTESRKGVLYLRAKKREESKEGEINQFCVLQLLYCTLCIADVPISTNLNLHFAASLGGAFCIAPVALSVVQFRIH